MLKDKLKIAHISDTHIDDRLSVEAKIDSRGNLLKVLNDVKNENTDVIILTGDIGEKKFFRMD